MKSRVFVVQQPSVYDREARQFVPKYDLSPATVYGDLEFILRPGNIFQERLNEATVQIAKALDSYTPDDFILALGDPVAIALTVLIAGRRTNGKVNLLKWDRIRFKYESFPIAA